MKVKNILITFLCIVIFFCLIGIVLPSCVSSNDNLIVSLGIGGLSVIILLFVLFANSILIKFLKKEKENEKK